MLLVGTPVKNFMILVISSLASCQSHYAAALNCSMFAAARSTTQRSGAMPIAPCCYSQLQRVCCRQQHHSARWRHATIASRCCSQLQLDCRCQQHPSAHWRHANRTMLPLSTAACLLPPVAQLSAVRSGSMPIAQCCCSQLRHVCCR